VYKLKNSPHKTKIFSLHAEKELITPPLNGLILPGITRHSILELAREWAEFKVSERTFTMPMVKALLKEKRVSKN
jgi:branched-chain amino acid aminotransferase